jgi:hypothetical protein
VTLVATSHRRNYFVVILISVAKYPMSYGTKSVVPRTPVPDILKLNL